VSPLKIGSTLRGQEGVLIVDVENVRGKSGFGLSHLDLVKQLTQWAYASQLNVGQVIMVVDHGSSQTAYWTETNDNDDDLGNTSPLAIVFAGPSQKADDVIAKDIGKISRWTQAWKNGRHAPPHIQEDDKDDSKQKENPTIEKRAPVMVVTDDQGLISRCRRSTARKYLEIISPLSLLEEMERVQAASLTINTNHAEEMTVVTQSYSKEISLAAECLLAQSKVEGARRKHIPNKRRKVMNDKLTAIQEKLQSTSSIGKKVYAFLQEKNVVAAAASKNNRMDSGEDDNQPSQHDNLDDDGDKERVLQAAQRHDLDPALALAVLDRWEQLQQSLQYRSFKKEKTEDRIVLADHFRTSLQTQFEQATQQLYMTTNNGQNSDNNNQELAILPPAQAYICDWIWTHQSWSSSSSSKNNNSDDDPVAESPFSTSTLRLVIIADTHGMEDQLGPLPPGDVLLHLGDFVLEGPAKTLSAKTFDQWLARQPHRQKIVLKGNHDPRGIQLPESGATYAVSPQTVHLAGFSIALVPSSSRLTTRCLPNHCDVVACHVPPRLVLDTCTSGKSAGCNTLKRRLRQMMQKSSSNTAGPKLVVCGHIHESRGWTWYDFSDPAAASAMITGTPQTGGEHRTLVVNAANANAGIAQAMEHGPVVVELTRETIEKGGSQQCDIRMKLQMGDDDIGLFAT